MAGNKAWSPEENAYCFIRLLEWNNLSTTAQEDAFLTAILQKPMFSARSMVGLRQHFDYLYEVVTNTHKKPNELPEKDKKYLNIYP